MGKEEDVLLCLLMCRLDFFMERTQKKMSPVAERMDGHGVPGEPCSPKEGLRGEGPADGTSTSI